MQEEDKTTWQDVSKFLGAKVLRQGNASFPSSERTCPIVKGLIACNLSTLGG